MDASGSSTYHAFIKDQLAEQEARKGSLEQRGVAVITTSGTLASLLLAFSALTAGTDDFALSPRVGCLVVGATVGFALAALAALATNIPLPYTGVPVEKMRALVEGRWHEDAMTAAQRTAAVTTDIIETAKKVNKVKAWLLFAAMVIEAVAVVLLAVAVGVILV